MVWVGEERRLNPSTLDMLEGLRQELDASDPDTTRISSWTHTIVQ